MAIFEYTATDKNGAAITDVITAAGRKDAIEAIFARGQQPLDVKERPAEQPRQSLFGSTRLSGSDVEMFTRQLGSLLASGMSLSKSLKLLCNEASKPAAKNVWTQIYQHVSNGMSLADSLRQWPKVFSTVYVAMVQAGETGGFIELVLSQIAEFREREQDLKSRVQAALVYPVILLLLAVLITVFLLVYFIPRFSSIFADFGGSLPPLTQWIVGASGVLMQYWFIIAAVIIGAVIGGKNFIARPQGQEFVEKWILKLPIIGGLTARFAFVRFTRMLGTLINSGVPLITALQVAKEAIGNQRLSSTVDGAIEKVRHGGSLSFGLRQCPELFSGTNVEMIAIAEESSRLGEELSRLAEVNEKELDRNLKTAVSFAEPLMLFLMAALVGTIVVGMLLPIFNLQDLIH